MKVLETGVVVVGGGAGAAYAASKLKDARIDAMMLVKGFVGRSGCTIFASQLIVPLPPEAVGGQVRTADPKKNLERWVKMTYYLGDQEGQKDRLEFAKKWIAEMEELGLYVRRLGDGKLLTNRPDANIVWAPTQGTSGRNVGDVLRKRVFHQGIDIREEVMVTSVLKNKGRAVGVTALDYRSGEFFAVRAKAVILATGIADYLAPRSTGTREQCANGRVMAYRAGCELYNLEMQLWHVSDTARPEAWMRLHNYAGGLPDTDKSIRLVNSKGEVFFDQRAMYPSWSGSPYHLQLRRLIKEVERGNANFDDGYYASYSHLDVERFREHSYQVHFFEKMGIDIRKQDVECGITWHQNYGGVEHDPETMQTAVPGLYVAGGVSGHASVFAACQTGALAAEAIAQSPSLAEAPELEGTQVEAEWKRVEDLTRTVGDGKVPPQVKQMVRRTMRDKLGPVKNERQMLEGLKEIARIRKEVVPRMRLPAGTKVWNYDLVDALDVVDMLDYGELMFHSSLMRKESRGPFYREDYPYVDNEHWLRRTVVRMRDSKMETLTREIDMKYVRPEEKRADWFSVDY